MLSALINGRIFDGSDILQQHAVLLEEGKVKALIPNSQLPEHCAVTDLQQQLLAPGFIDTQVNGGGGVLFNHQTSIDGIKAIGAAHRHFGTTGFLPTLISDSEPVMQRAIDAVKGALGQRVPGVLGIHLEGPYLNQARKGVHPADKLSAAGLDKLALLSPLATLGCSVITLAPEIVDPALIGALRAQGIRLSIGHSAASYRQTKAALALGINGFTHLFNAMPPLLSREPGLVGAALEDSDSYCGIIADTHHVHSTTLKLAVRAKALGKIMLVTDAIQSVGATGDTFDLMGRTIYRRDGKVTTAEGVLAGSDLDMASAVRNCVEYLQLPLEEALRMASRYPANFLGLEHSHGRIAEGFNADLVLLNEQLIVTKTWIDGQCEVAVPS